MIVKQQQAHLVLLEVHYELYGSGKVEKLLHGRPHNEDGRAGNQEAGTYFAR